MSEYSPKTLIVIALALVTEGGYRGDNPLMEKPEIKTLVTKILEARKTNQNQTTTSPLTPQI